MTMDKAKLAETVKAAQSGSESALESLYLEYAKSVYYLALKLMKNRDDAEDVTQEVFIYVFQKISELRAPEAFPAWLNRIAANKCTDSLRKKREPIDVKDEELLETEFFEESDPLLIPEKSFDNAETARMIVEIIDNLPTPQRLCVYYYYYEHLTIAQIAENLEANESTVKNRLALARQKIRKEIERLNEEEGIKLYTVWPLMLAPILKMSLQDFEMPMETLNKVYGSLTAQVGKKTIVKKAVSGGSKMKLIIAAAGVVLAVGGIAACVIIALNAGKVKEVPTSNPNVIADVAETPEPRTTSDAEELPEEEAPTEESNEYDYPEETSVELGNSSGNIVNKGIAAQKEGWIYYGVKNGLYKTKSDASETLQLSSEEAFSINVVDDWIFYCGVNLSDQTRSSQALYRMKTDGTGSKILFTAPQLWNLSVIGEWVYIVSDDGIYRFDIYGSNGLHIIDNIKDSNLSTISGVSVIGDWVYYNRIIIGDDYSVTVNAYKARTDGSDRDFLYPENAMNINVVGEWIYYYKPGDNWGIYKVKTDGTEEQLLVKDSANFINVSGEWIYYNPTIEIGMEIGSTLCRIKTNGTNKQEITDDNVSFINVVGDWIYYHNDRDNAIYRIRTDGTDREALEEPMESPM